MISSIINFLTSPLGIAILVAVFSAASRGWVKVQESRAKKTALQERREQERDALRTGKRFGQDEEPQEAPASVQWDERQEARRERIEQLRQQRIDQLRKIREQRLKGKSGGGAPQAPAQPTKKAPSAPAASTASSRSMSPGPSRTTSGSGMAARAPKQTAQFEPQRAAPRKAQRPPPPEPESTQKPLLNNEDASTPAISDLKPIAEKGVTLKGGPEPQRSAVDASRIFKNKQALRDAVVAHEILSPPVGMREAV